MNAHNVACAFAVAAVALGTLVWNTADAGGISLYEVGTADVGLASAGYSARAQDASTVFTNPAGMTRLARDELTLGAQMLYADLGFSIGQGTSPALGGNDGGNPVRWFPGGGMFFSHSVSPDFKVGLALAGNFGSAVKYDSGWVGRYRVQQGTLLGVSILPTAALRINENLSVGASLNAMYGKLENKVAVNNIVGSDGQLQLVRLSPWTAMGCPSACPRDTHGRMDAPRNVQLRRSLELIGSPPGLNAPAAAIQHRSHVSPPRPARRTDRHSTRRARSTPQPRLTRKRGTVKRCASARQNPC